jgi:hypothetical protein
MLSMSAPRITENKYVIKEHKHKHLDEVL